MSRIRLTERDLQLLSIFGMLVETGGLTAAEASLGMERSTISRHLQALEGRVGGTLCTRGPAGFQVTELGQKVYRAALAARDATLRAEEVLTEAVKGLSGKLLLGVADNTISNPDCHLVRAIGIFRSMAPDVQTNLSIAPPPEIIQDIIHRRLDYAFLAVPPARYGLAAEPLFDEEFRLYARRPASGALRLQDLAQFGLAIAMRADHWQSQVLAEELRLPHHGYARGLESEATLIASGGYVGFLPTHLVGALAPRYRMAEVRGAEHLRYAITFSLVYDRKRTTSPAGRAFAQVIRDVYGPYGRAPATGAFHGGKITTHEAVKVVRRRSGHVRE